MIRSTTLAVFGCALSCLAGAAAETNTFAIRAERVFSEARQKFRREPTNVVAMVRLARTAFDWGEFAVKDAQRIEIAEQGIEAARLAIRTESTNGAARYWLAMNLGQMARAKMLSALLLVREMEEEFLLACAHDPRTDHAGPERSLGTLYREAPGWPTSIGNKQKAREHLERAVQLEPDFPDNQLTLIEAYAKWSDRAAFHRQLKAVEDCMATARARFPGEEWEASHADWAKRWRVIKAQAAQMAPAAPHAGGK